MTVTDAPLPTEVPTGSLIATALPRIDYADAFSAPLPTGVANAEQLLRACLGKPSRSGHALLAVRDAFAGAAGLKTAESHDPAATTMRARQLPLPIGHVIAERSDEILWGLDDKHLDFRSSFIVRDGMGIVVTIVQFHNRLGRTYFAIIKPFHKMIVRRMLASAQRRSDGKSPPV
jgi:hypothetical protein